MENKIKLNLGCGQIRPEGWINTDSSINSFLQKLPFGKQITTLLGGKVYLSSNMSYMNLNRKWNKFNDSSANVVYSSHVLEHLTIKSSQLFLSEARRVLKKGGILRIVVPDLYMNSIEYVENYPKGLAESSSYYLRTLNLHREGQYPANASLIHKFLGFLQGYPHQHKYMYDKNSLSELLTANNFEQIVICDFGKSVYIDNIEDVEKEGGGWAN